MYGIYEGGSIIAKFVAPMIVRSNKPVFASDTLSLKRKTGQRTAQRWELETRLEPLSFGAEELFSNLIMKGHSVPTTIIMPQNYGAKQKLTSSSVPRASGVKDTSFITVIDNIGIIPKGTFIKFDGHAKVYMLTSNINNNGTFSIYPDLRINLTEVAFNYADNVLMTCFYDLNTIIGMTYSDGILMDVGTVKLVENV
jgi:hypothetical protein